MTFTTRITRTLSAIGLGVALWAAPATAAVIQSYGSGSAVTRVDASADFEDPASLGTAFSENGLSFSRTSLSTNNNNCGFAGCSRFFPTFSGNYLYGYGDGYLTIEAAQDRIFEGLEFAFGWAQTHSILWRAVLDGQTVDSGRSNRVDGGTVLGFSGQFDTLFFTSNHRRGAQFRGRGNSPAIDLVRAQYLPSVVPVPATLPLFLSALLGGAFLVRRRS